MNVLTHFTVISVFTITSIFAITSAVDTSNLTLVDKLRYDFIVLERNIWTNLKKSDGRFFKKEEQPEVSVIKKYQEFCKRLEQEFPSDTYHNLQPLEGTETSKKIFKEFSNVDTLYDTFRKFQYTQTQTPTISPEKAWEDLANAIIGENFFEGAQLGRIANVYGQLMAELNRDFLCKVRESPQQILLDLYDSISVVKLKAYLMIQYSYMILRIYGKENGMEVEKIRDVYKRDGLQSVEAVKKEAASAELWRCDPKTHEKDKTYLEITELLQGYLQNEVDLNSKGDCYDVCAGYSYTKNYGCFDDLWCSQQRTCNGKILNCKFYDSDMKICPGAEGSGRRYNHIEYENGKILGDRKSCPGGLKSVDSWWRFTWHCSYCMCLCDDPSERSDRYINMRPAVSDIKNNRVVTGLRFKKAHRIVHLQIQEGKLMPRGRIDPDTVHWVPLEEYRITDENKYDKQDYHTLSWESRALDLDDIVAEKDHLVTGVRFKLIGSHLNFEVFTTPFNYLKGELFDPEHRSFWKDNPNTDASQENPRKELRLNKPDVPTKSRQQSLPDSNSDQYVEFTNTDLEKDVGQTTVPFLDAQDVAGDKATPLCGAGIYHKGSNGFGGFVAPKIMSCDFRGQLSVPFPDGD